MRDLGVLLIISSLASAAALPRPLIIRDERDQVDFAMKISSPRSASDFKLIRPHIDGQGHPQEYQYGPYSTSNLEEHRERLVAMCEAGFVAHCQLSIEEANPVGNNDESQLKPLDGFEPSLSSISSQPMEDYYYYWSLAKILGFCVFFVTVGLTYSTHRHRTRDTEGSQSPAKFPGS